MRRTRPELSRRRFLDRIAAGAAGLFFASQTTNEGYLTREEYARFAKPYDLAVLEGVRGRSWFDIFHLHGEKVMFDELLDYPVPAINYHDRESGPSLSEMKTKTDKCLIGGIAQNTTLVHGTPEDVAAQVKDAWQQVAHLGLILGPGCVANRDAPEENVLAQRKAVEETARAK